MSASSGASGSRRARALVPLLAVAIWIGLVDAGEARVYRVKPSEASASVLHFRLGAIPRTRGRVISGHLVAGGERRALRVSVVRRAVRRGKLRLRSRAGRRARLVVVVDHRRPGRPAALRASGTPHGVVLTWRAARDDTGIRSYRIVRDGKRIATVPHTTRTYVDARATPGRRHEYAMRAIDRAGRRSAVSRASATATAPAQGGAAPGAAVSGEPAPAGDLPGWRLVFEDDFPTDVPTGSFPAAVASKWGAYPDGTRDTSGNGVYTPSKVVSIHDGVMDLHIRTDSTGHLVAVPVPRLQTPTGSQVYGRYAVRFRADPLPGYKVAWLLWPDSENWPHDGEIDFPEGDLDDQICGYVHHLGATVGNDQDAVCTGVSFTGWHTTVIEWTASQVVMYLDGRVILRSTTRIPNTPMHWVLQTETSLFSVPSPATSGHVLIDWVAAWSPR